MTDRINVLGVGFDSLTMDEAVQRALALIAEKRAAYVVTPNPEIVMLAREDAALMNAVEHAALVLPDGIGVVKGARILGTPLKEKIPGIDFATNLMAKMAENGQKLFLLGAKPGVAEMAAAALKERFPGLNICGSNDGYFQDDAPIIDKINAAEPDLLLVCLGAPKQELWMQANAPKLRVGLMAGLGGSLDVFAGVTERAPELWQKLGLEWFYRLLKEPSRAKRMSNLPKFGFAVIGKRLGGKY
ncbi:MAG: WecB/TagA/CpsF family glycosyltransferase [Oscillospiraceae bacterium]|jgi:N-acetylglucosaminyldiphosphoundecaprenol N-acetyl-beta-D-mannosaminyltransferase